MRLFILLSFLFSCGYSQTIGLSDEATTKDEQILEKLKMEFGPELKVKTISMQDAMEAIKKGEMDGFIGHVSITPEREKEYDFSIPYQQSKLKLLFKDNISFFIIIGHLIKPIMLFILVVVILGVIIWISERGSEEQFRNDRQGLFEAVYFACILATTTGLGDKHPATNAGRVITVITGLMAIVIYGYCFSAAMNVIDDSYKLPPSNYAVVEGTTGHAYVKDKGIQHVSYPTLSQAVLALHTGKNNAVLYDEPLLKPYENSDLRLSKESFSQEFYGILLKNKSEIRERINQAL